MQTDAPTESDDSAERLLVLRTIGQPLVAGQQQLTQVREILQWLVNESGRASIRCAHTHACTLTHTHTHARTHTHTHTHIPMQPYYYAQAEPYCA